MSIFFCNFAASKFVAESENKNNEIVTYHIGNDVVYSEGQEFCHC